jgi:hypothetical protein
MTSTSSSTAFNEKENGVPPPPPVTTGSSKASKQTPKIVAKTRIAWKSIDFKTFDVDDGVEKISHPFLEEENVLDLEISKVLIVQCPYKSKHGNKTGAWEHAARDLSRLQDGGSAIFTNGITAKQLKDRFMKLMDFVKQFYGQIFFRSGEDDEEAPGELLQLLEDLYEEYSSFVQDEILCSAKTAKARAEDRKKAEVLRLASLGELNSESRELVREARESSNKAPKTPPNGQYASTPSSGESELIRKYNERMSERVVMRKAREERKRKKLDDEREIAEQKLNVERERIAYDKKRFEMEQARFDLDRRDREAAAALDRRDREAAAALERRDREATTALLQTMTAKLFEQMSKK